MTDHLKSVRSLLSQARTHQTLHRTEQTLVGAIEGLLEWADLQAAPEPAEPPGSWLADGIREVYESATPEQHRRVEENPSGFLKHAAQAQVEPEQRRPASPCCHQSMTREGNHGDAICWHCGNCDADYIQLADGSIERIGLDDDDECAAYVQSEQVETEQPNRFTTACGLEKPCGHCGAKAWSHCYQVSAGHGRHSQCGPGCANGTPAAPAPDVERLRRLEEWLEREAQSPDSDHPDRAPAYALVLAMLKEALGGQP